MSAKTARETVPVRPHETRPVVFRTDALIQNTIRNKFRTCTVLTIAHRLNTVMDSDRILVLEAGAVVEFDRPRVLLQNKNGHLYKMVNQTGHVDAGLLHGAAAEVPARAFVDNQFSTWQRKQLY